MQVFADSKPNFFDRRRDAFCVVSDRRFGDALRQAPQGARRDHRLSGAASDDPGHLRLQDGFGAIFLYQSRRRTAEARSPHLIFRQRPRHDLDLASARHGRLNNAADFLRAVLDDHSRRKGQIALSKNFKKARWVNLNLSSSLAR